jgi:Fe-S oxidoreductase
MALSDYQKDMETCCRCSTCKFIPLENVKGYANVNVCPSIARYNFQAYSGSGRLALGMALLEKEIKPSDKLLEVVYNCQMCGACDVSCKYAMDMEVLEPINAVRRECVESGHTLPVFDKMIGKMRKSGRLAAGGTTLKGAWYDGLDVQDSQRAKTEVVYFAGCRTASNPALWKNAQAAVKLLQKAGIDIGTAGREETCCGGRAFYLGYQADFLKQAKANTVKWKKNGIKTIVTGCAECYHAFKVLYDRFELMAGIEVVHTSQYFASLIKSGKLVPSKAQNLTLTYNDPCHLGRMGEPYIHWSGKQLAGQIRLFDPPKEFRRGSFGVYEPPREVLKSLPGVTLLEMDRRKEFAWCCGAGGGVLENNPQFAQWTAGERTREAAATGARTIVTACPGCQGLLSATVKKQKMNMQVMDLAEVLAGAIL